VIVPVFDSPNPPATFSTNPVTVIGFVQLFMNPDGVKAPVTGPNPPLFRIKTTIVNLAGCGTNATGLPIIGNGASAVPVRLITP
jgi:hypothetical protein